ncbi:MAG: molybdopterin converting factor subunit 1 [Polyangia bacterium]
MAIIVRIRYFAHLRERLRRESETLTLADGRRVADLLDELSARYEPISGARKSVQVAVNQEVVQHDRVLRDGDEIALIPPVSGGSPRCRISTEPLSWQEVVDAVSGPGQGGLVVFCGNVRDHNQGKDVVRLDYEAYDEMAVRAMDQIASRIESEYPGARIAITHRTGTLNIGDTAVLVAASAPHRAEAFAACRAAIEALKQEVPIWKKEYSADGAEWLGQGP